MIATGRSCTASGSSGLAGNVIVTQVDVTSSGACSTYSRQPRSTSAASSSGYMVAAKATSGPSGCSSKVNEVTIPKLPPPPRSAQYRSGWELADAVRTSPSAQTTSASTRLSQDSPYLRLIQP